MNKKWTLYLVILGLILAATGCDPEPGQAAAPSETNEAAAPSENKQTPEVENDYPPRLRFIGGHTDPLTAKTVDELKALLAQQLEAIGGWQGVKETLALDLVPQATSFMQSACPHCREQHLQRLNQIEERFRAARRIKPD